MNKTINLVDINDVKINTSLPKEERMKDFVDQIGDPNNFKCGDFTVKLIFESNGISLEDCIADILI